MQKNANKLTDPTPPTPLTQPVGTDFPEVAWPVAMTSHNQLVAPGGLALCSSRFQYADLRSVTEHTSARLILLCSVNVSAVFNASFESVGSRTGSILDAGNARGAQRH